MFNTVKWILGNSHDEDSGTFWKVLNYLYLFQQGEVGEEAALLLSESVGSVFKLVSSALST